MRLPCESRYGAPDGYWFKSIRRNQSFLIFESLPQTLRPSEFMIFVVKGYREFVSYFQFPSQITSGLPVIRSKFKR